MKRIVQGQMRGFFTLLNECGLAMLLIAFPVQLQSRQSTAAPVIGFVEDNPAAQEGVSSAGLRIAFQRNDNRWTTVTAPPSDQAGINHSTIKGIEARQRWQVVDGGHVLGALRTEGWLSSDTYSLHGLLRVIDKAPAVGSTSALYGGWTGEARHRPLLAILGSPTVKPASWRIDAVHPADAKAIWPAFRKAVPMVPRCDAHGEQITPEPTTTLADVKVTRALSDDRGARLLCASLREDRLGACDGIEERPVSDFWFFISKGGHLTLLAMPEGDDAITLTPLDFVNLDGETSAVFFCSGYNRDGYILYYNNFKESVEFFWSYH